MRSSVVFAGVLCHIVLVACGGDAGSARSPVYIRGVGTLEGLEQYDGPPPTPTSTGYEPMVTHLYIDQTDGDTYALVVHVESVVSIDTVYFVSDGSTFVAHIPAPWTVRNWCAQLRSGCSEACLEACSCADCPTEAAASAAITACAVNCTAWADLISEDSTFTSEQDFANQVYRGLAQSSSCDFSACEEAALPEKAIYFPFPASLYDPLPPLTSGDQAPVIAVEGPRPGGGRIVSDGLAPGGPIRTCDRGVAPCR